MKKLADILRGIDYTATLPVDKIIIDNISFDSRKMPGNSLFIAVKGTETDGHIFIPDAVKKGAPAIVCESIPPDADPGLCWIRVNNSARALGLCASNFFNRPSEELRLVGATGTNGKTTTVSLLYDLFTGLGYKAGLISTVVNRIAGKEIKATLTTPDPVSINSLLRQMSDAGCEFAFMEISSHAIVQERTAGLRFSMGIFTNITHDHLDYHGTFDSYLAAKKKFFDDLPADSIALVNADDRNAGVMLQNCRASGYSYSLKTAAEYRCRIIEHRFDGMNLRFGDDEMWTVFIGEFNAYNLLAVASAADLLGQERLEVLTGISRLRPVPGRFEVIRSDRGLTAIVDYAHSPDALANVLSAINNIRVPGTRLITVVGAGGDRDRSKRPVMARIAAEKSDRLILTSDNPRTEEPESIIEDMMRGVPAGKESGVLRITDRREAIRSAVMIAAENDIILVAGKGHEAYQEVMGKRHHFDDREELRQLFKSVN